MKKYKNIMMLLVVVVLASCDLEEVEALNGLSTDAISPKL